MGIVVLLLAAILITLLGLWSVAFWVIGIFMLLALVVGVILGVLFLVTQAFAKLAAWTTAWTSTPPPTQLF